MLGNWSPKVFFFLELAFFPLEYIMIPLPRLIMTNNNESVTNEYVWAETREIYTLVLLDILRSKVSVENRTSLEKIITNSRRQTPVYAKNIISENKTKKGKATFRTLLKKFYQFCWIKTPWREWFQHWSRQLFYGLIKNTYWFKYNTFLWKESRYTKKKLPKGYDLCATVKLKKFMAHSWHPSNKHFLRHLPASLNLKKYM